MTSDERCAPQVAEGKARAAAVRAAMSPKDLARLEVVLAGLPDLLTRTFVSPDNGKGRQSFYFATAAELAEWKAR